jgi:hypothetical protein
MPERDSGPSGTGPVDAELLDRIAGHLRGSKRFTEISSQPPAAPNAVLAAYDLGYFPAGVDRAYLRLRWFETDDFSIHYSEQYRDGDLWECRWDRHPNDHNTRDHFHPPPDAATPGEDADYATEWRDVLVRVLTLVDERIEAFWE